MANIDADLAKEVDAGFEMIGPHIPDNCTTPLDFARYCATMARATTTEILCRGVARYLVHLANELEKASPAQRARIEKRQAPLFQVLRDQPEQTGDLTRGMAHAMAMTSLARERYGPKRALLLFGCILSKLAVVAPERLTDSTLGLVDACARVWRRRAGAPRTRDREFKGKWVAFADMMQALGLATIDPEHAKKECALSRTKNRRAVRFWDAI